MAAGYGGAISGPWPGPAIWGAFSFSPVPVSPRVKAACASQTIFAAAWAWLKFITSGEGAAEVAKTTGYMPPNKAANEIILADFYKANPNKQTAVDQLPLLRDWLAYPGDKGLAITQVIYDGMEKLATGEASDVADLQQEMAEEAGDLMPR